MRTVYLVFTETCLGEINKSLCSRSEILGDAKRGRESGHFTASNGHRLSDKFSTIDRTPMTAPFSSVSRTSLCTLTVCTFVGSIWQIRIHGLGWIVKERSSKGLGFE